MKILINTDGDGSKTSISINGNILTKTEEFHISICGQKKVKLQIVRELDGKKEFVSYFGDDFKKYDEFNPPK